MEEEEEVAEEAARNASAAARRGTSRTHVPRRAIFFCAMRSIFSPIWEERLLLMGVDGDFLIEQRRRVLLKPWWRLLGLLGRRRRRQDLQHMRRRRPSEPTTSAATARSRRSARATRAGAKGTSRETAPVSLRLEACACKMADWPRKCLRTKTYRTEEDCD
ncbi:hypothetical protein C8J57DRAFT_1252307 [Mycena rebaudengoi]|nr:hypothetical protein C8J57DRAFT_1252307 [Mycena rebaudengoi]